jgi:hypothetical protein
LNAVIGKEQKDQVSLLWHPAGFRHSL